METYIFQSKRLGFRNWNLDDLDAMAKINADPTVMEYFPTTQDKDQTEGFIKRMIEQYDNRGYCYYAVEKIQTRELIGFIGISYQTYVSNFTPCVDIGWRLNKSFWGFGFATEGAIKCLEYAFTNLSIKDIYSVAVSSNTPSIKVMKKIGMEYQNNFDHPLLLNNDQFRDCVLYKLSKTNFSIVPIS